VALRAGGGFAHPRAAAESTRRLDRAIEIAAIVGATVVNSALVTPVTDPKGPGIFVGEPVSQGSSRLASEEDFIRTASALQKAGKLAMDKGLDISIEVHQRSIADNGWSANHLLELINRPNVGVNPDLGNVYWTYEEPEETCEAAISALAPLSNYWHCKNLVRVHIPENNHSIFLQTALPDGDIDYRFAISAMLDAGYKGYLALEGTRKGDTLSKDDRSVAYVNALLKELGKGK
jgi:sugar phosphate isomerase/epimerase